MRKHFFSARNLEDYKRHVRTILAGTGDNPNLEALKHFNQDALFAYIKDLLKFPEGIFDSRIVGETPIPGLRLDFNCGLRLDVPEGNFRIRISDADSEQIFFDKYVSGGRLISVEQIFIRWRIEVFRDGKLIFTHTLDLEGQPVMLMFRFNALGDLIALLPYAREFKRRHRCKLSICLPNNTLSEFAAHLYPELPQADAVTFETYATYYPSMVLGYTPVAPINLRDMPMERMGGAFLGLNFLAPKPTFKPTMPPVTNEPYVCIGVQASSTVKGWLYPNGWEVVVDYLKGLGYRVFCIDKNSVQTNGGITIRKPENAEDFTGDFTIMERANMLYHAEFFIGLGSGLSWVANAVGCPVVMICGFTTDWHEFYTPYRVANRLVCNGCYNDVHVDFLGKLCPYQKGTPRELECQKKISPRQVLNAIERLIIDRNLTPPRLRSV